VKKYKLVMRLGGVVWIGWKKEERKKEE